MGLYSEYIRACGRYVRKDSYKTINKLPKNLNGISKREFSRMLNTPLLNSTLKNSYALLTPDDIRAMYYALLEHLLANRNGKLTKTARAIKNEIDKFFTYQYDYNNLPEKFRNFIDYFETSGYFNELRSANNLNRRIKIAYNLLNAYLETHRGKLDDFIRLNNRLGEYTKEVFSKWGTWAISIPAAYELQRLYGYLQYNQLLRMYEYSGDYENLVKYINPFTNNIIDDFASYIGNAIATEGRGIINLTKDILIMLEADRLSGFTTQLLESGIFRSFYHLARASYLAGKTAKFLSSLFGGFIGFAGFTAFEWLVLEPFYNILLSDLLDAIIPPGENKPHPAEIWSLYDYLDKIRKGYDLNDVEKAHFDYLRNKYGDKALFSILNKLEVLDYLKQIEDLKSYFEDELVENFEDYVNGYIGKEELDNIVKIIEGLEKTKQILTQENVNVRSCSRGRSKVIDEMKKTSKRYRYNYYKESTWRKKYRGALYGYLIGGKYVSDGQLLKKRYYNYFHDLGSIYTHFLENNLINPDLFIPILKSLKNNTFDPASLSAYLYNDVIVFSYYNKVRDILKPIIRNKCISLSYLRKNKIFKIPVVLGSVKISYASHFLEIIRFEHHKLVKPSVEHFYLYEYLREKWLDVNLYLQFTTDENNNPTIELFYDFDGYGSYIRIKSYSILIRYPLNIKMNCDCLDPPPYVLTRFICDIGEVVEEEVNEYENEVRISKHEQLYTISVPAPSVPFKKPKYICLIED